MTRSCVMPLAAWVLLATFTWCSYAHAAPVPPVAAALSSTSQDLPGSQAWVGGAGDLYPISQEGSKRGYSDRNYLSNEDKRSRNFLRFGRSDLGDYDNSGDENLNESLEKRSRNFLRFGRNDMEDMFVAGGPMEFLASLQDEEVKQDLPFEKHVAYRHGRGGRNFLRFGRSVDRQLNSVSCDGCDGPKTPGIISTPTSTHVQPMTHTKLDTSAHSIESSEPWENSSQRIKRAAASTFNDYGSMRSYSPISWARGFQPEEEIITVSSEDPQDVNKRANDRNFLRFGRDRNFLRFGKRDRSNEYPPSSSESSGSLVLVRPVKFSRYLRAPQRNFLRFG